MGRRRESSEDRVATAIRLPVSLHRDLLAVAAERDVSVNKLVTKAVADFLCRVPPGSDPFADLDSPRKAARR